MCDRRDGLSFGFQRSRGLSNNILPHWACVVFLYGSFSYQRAFVIRTYEVDEAVGAEKRLLPRAIEK